CRRLRRRSPRSPILRILARPQNARRRNAALRLRARRPSIRQPQTPARRNRPHSSLVRRPPALIQSIDPEQKAQRLSAASISPPPAPQISPNGYLSHRRASPVLLEPARHSARLTLRHSKERAMGKFSRSWALMRESFAILRSDKQLMLFPILSAISCLFVTALIATGGAFAIFPQI